MTPIRSAVLLHQAWDDSELRVVADAGHAMTEPGIVHELIRATRKYSTPAARFALLKRSPLGAGSRASAGGSRLVEILHAIPDLFIDAFQVVERLIDLFDLSATASCRRAVHQTEKCLRFERLFKRFDAVLEVSVFLFELEKCSAAVAAGV